MVRVLYPYITTGKIITLTIWTFVSKVMSLLFRFVIAFLPGSRCHLISWLHSPFTIILEPKEIKSVTASTSSQSICHKVMELDAMIIVFCMLSFKAAFSLSAIRLVSSAYWSLWLVLLTVLIIAFDSFSLAFCMMYPKYKLNKQGDNIQSWCTPFPIWNQSIVPCAVLSVASCPAYWILRRQVRWSSIPVTLKIFHSLLCSTQSKGFK